MTTKNLWYAVSARTGAAQLNAVFHRNFACILVHAKQAHLLVSIPPPTCIDIAVVVKSEAELNATMENEAFTENLKFVLTADAELLGAVRRAAKSRDIGVGMVHAVVDNASLEASLPLAKNLDCLVLTFKDPTNIPLELVLATTQNESCRIAKWVEGADDGANSLLTMESGADVVVLETNDVKQIAKLDDVVSRTQRQQLELAPARVTAIRHAGMGDRVCIDTTSELFQDEGMLVGSTSSGGLFVCSETHDLPYMNLRPFRVNAGALHLYAWGPDNRTVYLSDLKAGSEMLAVNQAGEARRVTVGRVKIERRPLLYIEAEIEGVAINAFIQDDWHVRLMGHDGTIRPCREVRVGEQLLAYRDVPGRHVGIAIKETIVER